MRNAAIKRQSLLNSAFEVLLENLGPQKASQLWQILTPSVTDYLQIRPKLFKGKAIGPLYKEAKKFNRR